MKLLFLRLSMALFMLPILVACENSVVSDVDISNVEENEKEISVNVSYLEDLPFGDGVDTRAIADNTIDYLTFALFGDSTYIIKQDTLDRNFGSISQKIRFGTYKLVVVGNKGGTDIKGYTVTSAELVQTSSGKVGDTFCYIGDLKVDADSESTVNVTLKRAVSRLEIRSTDIPTQKVVGASQLKLTLAGAGNKLNPTTGLAIETTPLNLTFDLKDGKTIGVAAYMFLPTDPATISVKAEILDASSKVLFTRTFENLEIKINRKLVFSGEFFSSQNTINLDIDSVWSTDDKREL